MWTAEAALRGRLLDDADFRLRRSQPHTNFQVVVQAAYRALAALYHPDSDQSAASTRRMAELNDAYAQNCGHLTEGPFTIASGPRCMRSSPRSAKGQHSPCHRARRQSGHG